MEIISSIFAKHRGMKLDYKEFGKIQKHGN